MRYDSHNGLGGARGSTSFSPSMALSASSTTRGAGQLGFVQNRAKPPRAASHSTPLIDCSEPGLRVWSGLG